MHDINELSSIVPLKRKHMKQFQVIAKKGMVYTLIVALFFLYLKIFTNHLQKFFL